MLSAVCRLSRCTLSGVDEGNPNSMICVHDWSPNFLLLFDHVRRVQYPLYIAYHGAYCDCTYQFTQRYRKGGTFEYRAGSIANFDDYIVQCSILRTEVTGCAIEVQNWKGSTTKDIEIDFTVENDNLSRLEPCLNRPGMLPVDFIHEGFLIRCRPNLDEFLDCASEDFDVVIYTSALKQIYEGMLKVLHEYLSDLLGRDQESKLWTDALYRDDCELKAEAGHKPFHHKDLTLFGCHLSRTVMIDNAPHVVAGQEPNIILIRDFFGREQHDEEVEYINALMF